MDWNKFFDSFLFGCQKNEEHEEHEEAKKTNKTRVIDRMEEPTEEPDGLVIKETETKVKAVKVKKPDNKKTTKKTSKSKK